MSYLSHTQLIALYGGVLALLLTVCVWAALVYGRYCRRLGQLDDLIDWPKHYEHWEDQENMNPQANEKMTVVDYATTGIQVIAAIVGAVLAFTGQPVVGGALLVGALSGGSKGSLAADLAKLAVKGVKKSALPVIAIAAVAIGLTGCLEHPLLRPDSISAVMRTATPYIVAEDGALCSNVELYAGYRLRWDEIDPSGDPAFAHGFGGIVGGCGRFAKIVCDVAQACGAGGSDCNEVVICEVLQVLVPEAIGD